MKQLIDIRHYIDFCASCEDEDVELYEMPYSLEIDGESLMARYRCPTGHEWPCWWSVQRNEWTEIN